MPTFLNPPDNPGEKFGLSSGAIAGPYVFAAGMALDWETMQRMEAADSIADEVRICLQKVESTLKKAGCTLRDVVKTTCWISDESYRREFFETYRDVFGEPPYPARSTMVAGIACGCRVEIDALAMKSD